MSKETILNNEDLNSEKELKGGFKLFKFGDSFGKTIRRTKLSEGKLIKTYGIMDSATKHYQKSYDTHLQNLEKLDDYANFNGMENLFKKVIMKENFKNGKVDKSLPILFRNYLIEDETAPSAFRKEHIMRQVNYVLDKYFAGREHMFIKSMSVDVGKNEIILYITTIENIKKSRKINHSGYVISISETKSALKEILATTKKNLKRNSSIIQYNHNSNNSSDNSNSNNNHKTKTKHKTKTGSKTKHKTGSRTKTKIKMRSLGNISLLKTIKTKKYSNKSYGNQLPGNIKLGTQKTKESSKRATLDLFLTQSQRKAKRQPPPQPPGLPLVTQYGQPQIPGTPGVPGIAEGKKQILETPINYQAPAEQVIDPEEAKCNALQGYDLCATDRSCFFKHGKCNKRPPLPAFGAPPGGFGAPPGGFAPGAFTAPLPPPQNTIQL